MDCSIFDRVYAGMLKSASEFQTGNQDETIEYHFDPQLEKVVSKYHLTDVAGQGPDSQKIIRMVEWMTASTTGSLTTTSNPVQKSCSNFPLTREKKTASTACLCPLP